MNDKIQKIINILRKGNTNAYKLAQDIVNIFNSEKWFLPSDILPERIKEHWCPEETAQEVIIQYFKSKRYQMCTGWYENGQWWSNDEVIDHPVVAWKHLPRKYKPEIEWDFVMWNDKSTNDAQLKGEDEFGLQYYGSSAWSDGKPIYDVKDIELIESN